MAAIFQIFQIFQFWQRMDWGRHLTVGAVHSVDACASSQHTTSGTLKASLSSELFTSSPSSVVGAGRTIDLLHWPSFRLDSPTSCIEARRWLAATSGRLSQRCMLVQQRLESSVVQSEEIVAVVWRINSCCYKVRTQHALGHSWRRRCQTIASCVEQWSMSLSAQRRRTW